MKKLNVNLNLYKSFYYVAKYEGFTKASEYALLSQSALSNNIKTLEIELDVELFKRGKSKVELTDYGKELYNKLEQTIHILESEEENKIIRIGCLRFIADSFLEKTIKKYNKKHPEVSISIEFSDDTDLFRKLRKDDLDIVLCRYPVMYKIENMNIEKIKDVNNVFVCSKKYYEKEHKKMKSPEYLFNLILPSASEKRRAIEKYLENKKINYKVPVELPNSLLLKHLIETGIGIGYINKEFVLQELETGEFIVVDTFDDVPLDNISVITNVDSEKDIVKEFIEIFKTTI